MRFGAAVVALAAVLMLPATTRAAGRATTNRPDQVVGPSLHALYVLPPGAEDRHLDTDGEIAAGIAAFNGWFAAHTGTTFRIDTYEGQPDVTFVQLKAPDGDSIVNDLRALGFDQPNAVYLVYLGGRSPRDPSGRAYSCGGWDQLPPPWGYSFAMQYVGDSVDDPAGYCYPDPTTFDDRAMLDYVIHALGFPAACAPHYDPTSGQLTDDPNDIISGGDDGVDLGHDDYFGPPGDDNLPAGCPNLAQSPFLTWNVYDRLVVPISGRGEVAAFAVGRSEPVLFCRPRPCDPVMDEPQGTRVTLVATPAYHWRFAGWSGGGCARRLKCRVSLTKDVNVRARFVRISRSRG